MATEVLSAEWMAVPWRWRDRARGLSLWTDAPQSCDPVSLSPLPKRGYRLCRHHLCEQAPSTHASHSPVARHLQGRVHAHLSARVAPRVRYGASFAAPAANQCAHRAAEHPTPGSRHGNGRTVSEGGGTKAKNIAILWSPRDDVPTNRKALAPPPSTVRPSWARWGAKAAQCGYGWSNARMAKR